LDPFSETSYLGCLQKQKEHLKANQSDRVLKAMEPDLEPEGILESEAPVGAATRYLKHRLDQLGYKMALDNRIVGWVRD